LKESGLREMRWQYLEQLYTRFRGGVRSTGISGQLEALSLIERFRPIKVDGLVKSQR
jgi:hypothetical protein